MARRRNNKKVDDVKRSGAQRTNSNNLALSPVQLMSTANVPYGYPAGTTIEDLTTYNGMAYTATMEIPGVGVYYVTPHIGVSTNANSVINLAAKRLFSSFIYANGKNPTYQSADAVLIPLAVGQVAAMYDFACRAYRLLNTYIQQNRYFPKMMIEAMQLDYADFVVHMADFSAWLENLRFKLQSLFIPNNLPIIDEWRSAYRDIYVDEPNNPKAQFFMFVPRSVLVYSATAYNTGGALIPVDYLVNAGSPAVPVLYTYAQFTAFIDAMVDVLVYDDDVNKIMADIMLAYGPESVDQLNAIDLGAAVEFKYDPIVNATIHNASIFANSTYVNNPGHTGSSDSREVYQDNNVIYHTPAWQCNKKSALLTHVGAMLLDSPTSEVSPLLNIAMTRMSTIIPNIKVSGKHGSSVSIGPGYWSDAGQAYATVMPNDLGVYTIDEFYIYKPVNSGGFTLTRCDGFFHKPGGLSPMFNGWEKFDMHPLLSMVDFGAGVATNNDVVGPSSLKLDAIFGDLHFYTILTQVDLEKMHETFILAQLSAGLRG